MGAIGAEFPPQYAGQENNNRGTDQTLFPNTYEILDHMYLLWLILFAT